jgi:multicomponent Na+:H+ antiporter subunit D
MSPLIPILIPLVTGILLLALWGLRGPQRIVSVLGSLLHVAASIVLLLEVRTSGIQLAYSGSWPAPIGITFAVDTFGALMVLIAAILGLCGVIFSVVTTDEESDSAGYYPMVQFLLLGVVGSFTTGDLFNLFVWFEVMLISSFVLLSLGGGKARLTGTLKYVVLNLLSSIIFLSAIGLMYGFYGTLNFADLSLAVSQFEGEYHPAPVLMILFFIAFAIKSGLFPFYFWLPASYHLPHPAVSAIFSGLLTKVGVYAMIRLLTLIFFSELDGSQNLILLMAGLTMVTGVFGALSQNGFRRILSFHIVSQIGYMLMGLGIATVMGLAGGIFYMCHHMLVKANLFFIAGAVEHERSTGSLKKLGGLFGQLPFLGILFLISAFSLAGLPPFSGFFAKFILVRSGMEAGTWGIVIVSIVVSFFTLQSMTKIWNEVFWKKPADDLKIAPTTTSQKFWLRTPIVTLALFSIGLGIFAEPFFQICEQAAREMLNPEIYIEAVLGIREGAE